MPCLGLLLFIALFFDLAAPISAQPAETSSKRQPSEVKPPREPENQRIRLGLTIGIDVLPWVDYSYRTTVLANGREYQYTGKGGAPGIALSASAAVTLPGKLRRLTVGGVIQGGGLYTVNQAVAPADASVPFSTQNLQQAIRAQHPFGEGWHTSVSPYIEHDIATMGDNKLRLGYQYLTQTGSYDGLFYQSKLGGVTAAYDVQLQYQSHLVRFSWTNYVGSAGGHKTGLLRQMGICAGTNKTILIFFAIGPLWTL